ncbi:lytic transglycosylase, partial [Streptomyces mirabilis]
QSQMNAAILNYNNSTEYLNTVLSWLEYYRKGAHERHLDRGRWPDLSTRGVLNRHDNHRPIDIRPLQGGDGSQRPPVPHR